MPLKQHFRTAITDTWTDAAKGDPVGSVRWEWDADNNLMRCYKCVKYDNGDDSVAAVVGKLAMYVDDTGFAASTVTMDKTNGTTIAAGIFLSIIPDAGYGWIQTKGRCVGVSGLLNAACNDNLTISAVDNTTDGEIGVPDADTEQVCGFVIDESAYEIYCDFPF